MQFFYKTFILALTIHTVSSVQIVEQHTEHMQDVIPTEATAYQLISASKDAIKYDGTYVAIPWTYLLNHNQIDRIQPTRVHAGFTVCQHVYFEQILPLAREMGITTIFTPHAEQAKHYGDDISIVPFPHYPVNAMTPSPHKDIWYSFIGFNTHPVRTQIFDIPNSSHVIIKERKLWHFSNSATQQTVEKKEYQNVLSRSRFSLCPRGVGAGTPRLWESMSAGAIPVLIADTFELPTGFDWDNAIIRLPQCEVGNLENLLQNITTEQEAKMRENCIDIFKKISGDNYINIIKNHLEQTDSHSH